MTSKEALENIRDFKPFGYDTTHKEEYALSGTLNDYLQEELSIIEKDLERLEKLEIAFSLIKNKKVDVWYEIILSVRYDDYLDQKTDLSEELTEEEYDLLKEILK